MASKYQWADVEKFINDNGLYFSDADMRLAQNNPDAGMSIANYKIDYNNATTDDQRALANAGAEKIRKDYGGYTGGSDGSKFYLNEPSPQNYGYQQPADKQSYTYQQPGQQSSFNDQTNIGTPPGYGVGSAEGGLPEGSLQNNPQTGQTPVETGKQNTNIGQYSDWKNPYQELSNAALDKVLNREEFVDPNESVLQNAYGNVMNYGPYEDPNADTLNSAYQTVMNQGGFVDPNAEMLNNAYQNFMNQGSWENQFADQQQELLNQILNQQEFSYNPDEDLAWQSARKQYLREADRATQNMLGDMAGLTGGMASTAAISAASQAGDYYRGQLADRLPEYQQAAYQRWLDGIANDKDKLNILNNMSEADYAKFMDNVQLNYNKYSTANQMSEQNYNKFVDQINRDIAKYEIANQQSEQNYDKYLNGYNQGLSQYETAKGMSDSNYQKWVDALGFDYDNLSVLNSLGQQMRDEFDTDRNFGYNQWLDELGYRTDKENTEYERAEAQDQKEYERAQYAKEYADSTNDTLAKMYLSLYDSTMNSKYLDMAIARIEEIGK